MPCGFIQPIKKQIIKNKNKKIDNPILMVKAFAIFAGSISDFDWSNLNKATPNASMIADKMLYIIMFILLP